MRTLAFTLSITCTALLLACASGRPADGEPGVVAIAELPPAHREALEAYTAGGDAWEAMRERVRRDPDLVRFMVENLSVELVRSYEALAGDDYDRARRAFDRARAELVRFAPSSTPFLVELFAIGDGIVAQLVGETLVQIGGGAAVLVVPLLEGEDAQRRRRAAVLLRDLPPVSHGHPGREQVAGNLARLAASDPEWFVRAECAWTLGVRAGRGRDPRAARARLTMVLADPDLVVAAYAARGLGAIEDPRDVPVLAQALERAVLEGSPRLLRSAQDALRAVTGTSRDRDLDGWMSWWNDRARRR